MASGKIDDRIDRIDQVDCAVEHTIAIQPHDLGHQFHQTTLAAIRIAAQRQITIQVARPMDRIVRTPHRMQPQIQFADTRLTCMQPAEKRGVGMSVMKLVGGKAETHRVSLHQEFGVLASGSSRTSLKSIWPAGTSVTCVYATWPSCG